MTKDQLINLATHVATAKTKAKEAADAVDDGGTANLDTLVIYLPRTREKSLIDAGIEGYRLRGGWALRGFHHGQGQKQTAGVRAGAEYLRQHGYDATVWYQMD